MAGRSSAGVLTAERMFGTISDGIHRVDLTTEQSTPGGQVELPPVVLAAMRDMSLLVNHSNGLGGADDKAIAISILQALLRGGHRFDVDDLCAWALANGFTATQVEHLRDYAAKALSGHRFRLNGRHPLRADILQQWEAMAYGERRG